MNRAAQLRGLADLRTVVSTHGPGRPRRKESVYLDLYRLEKERERLEVELAMLLARAERVHRRMREIDTSTGGMLRTPGPTGGLPRPPGLDALAGWRRVTVGY